MPANIDTISPAENYARMQRGELYFAFTPDLCAARDRAAIACERFNAAGRATPRRRLVELWRDVIGDTTPLPLSEDGGKDEDLKDEPYVTAPIMVDYGTHIKLGKDVYLNSNSCFVDTCDITIGSRTLVGPHVSFYSGTHPLDPFLRNGTAGPELGKPITIGEDCWIGGHSIILPGVTLGRGVVVGAGSVVTKDVPAFHVIAGNPARVIRKIDSGAGSPSSRESRDEIRMPEDAAEQQHLDGPRSS